MQPTSGPQRWEWDRVMVQCASQGEKGIGRCADACECVEGGVSRWTVCQVFQPPLYVWPTVWLTPDWRCVLHQPMASQVYLLQVTPARLTALTLVIQVSAMVTLSFYRTPSNPLFPARDYLPIHHVHRNYFKQALLCSIKLGCIKCNLKMAKIGILSWENKCTKIAILPK